MRRVHLAVISLLLMAVALSANLGDGRVTVMWDYPEAELPGVTFRIYHSTNLSQPLPWNFFLAVEATNRAHLVLTPGVNFAYVTASNFWGESAPSNVAGTPTLPQYINTLQIRRGHE